MKKTILSIVISGLLLCTASLSIAEQGFVLKSPQTHFVASSSNEKNLGYQERAKWTFMVYLNGDNDLEYVATQSQGKIKWMEGVGSSDYLNIVYQFDALDLFEGTRRFYVNSNHTSELIENMDEQNMGDPETLIDFVSWASSNYPAEKYCLVFLGHGCGWQNGFCYDETSGKDYLSMSELKYAMNQINNHLGEKIDIVLFDSCLMAMTEVYYQLRDTVDICIGSEALLYDRGCNYDLFLNELKNNPQADATTFARYIVNESASYYSGCYMPVTISAISEEDLTTTVTSKLDAFAILLIDHFSTYKQEIKAAITSTTSYNGGNNYQTHYKDLYNFTQEILKIIPDATIQQSAIELISALEGCIIEEQHYSYAGSHGISIYIPTFSLRYPYNADYETLEISIDTHWDEFAKKSSMLFTNLVSSSSSMLSGSSWQSSPTQIIENVIASYNIKTVSHLLQN